MDNIFLCILLMVVCSCNAEAPVFRQKNEFFARQEIDETDNVGSYPEAQGPYSPAGFRPNRAFNLPTENRQIEENIAVPIQMYGAPSQQYGSPKKSVDLPNESSGEEPVDDESEFETVDVLGSDTQKQPENTRSNQQGLYYFQLPSGFLQPVNYVVAPVSSQLLAKVQLQPLVQPQPIQPVAAASPLVLSNLVVPKSYSFTSQYQSW